MQQPSLPRTAAQHIHQYRTIVSPPRPHHWHHRPRHAACPALATPPPSGGLDYKAAGVDIDAGNELVNRIKKLNPNIGGFGGLVPFGDSFLVAGTDGVGTKLKLAFEMNKHDTIGIDLVAMSVNDVITLGAKPLFFLDYFACGRLDVDQAENVRSIVCCDMCYCVLLYKTQQYTELAVEEVTTTTTTQVIKGIVEGCNQSECTLLGGEVRTGDYDCGNDDEEKEEDW